MDRNHTTNQQDTAVRDRRKRLLWSLLSALIAVLTVWAVTSQAKGFSFRALRDCLAEADPIWMLLAFAGMLGFIFFEGCALRSVISDKNARLSPYLQLSGSDRLPLVIPKGSVL